MTDDELRELVASLAIAQQKTDEQMNRTEEQMKLTDEQMKRTDEQLKRTDEQLKRTDEKLERIGIRLGNISNNQGDVAEEFFFNSLAKDTHLGPIHFDEITMNMKKHQGQIQEEYDLVMTNSEAVGIIEVKYKAHEHDLKKLERKMRNFKVLFPWFKDYKIYGALAAFHVNEIAKKEALEQGFFVLLAPVQVANCRNQLVARGDCLGKDLS